MLLQGLLVDAGRLVAHQAGVDLVDPPKGQGDLPHLGPEGGEVLQEPGEGLSHLHPQPPLQKVQGHPEGGVLGALQGEGFPGQDLREEVGVPHRLGEGARVVRGAGEGKGPLEAHPAVGGLKPTTPLKPAGMRMDPVSEPKERGRFQAPRPRRSRR